MCDTLFVSAAWFMWFGDTEMNTLLILKHHSTVCGSSIHPTDICRKHKTSSRHMLNRLSSNPVKTLSLVETHRQITIYSLGKYNNLGVCKILQCPETDSL